MKMSIHIHTKPLSIIGDQPSLVDLLPDLSKSTQYSLAHDIAMNSTKWDRKGKGSFTRMQRDLIYNVGLHSGENYEKVGRSWVAT
jgi:hypothetical protein